MSDWKLVVPLGTTNMVLNPSAEITGNYAAGGAATVTRYLSSNGTWRGNYCYRVQTTAANDGIDLGTATFTAQDYYLTLWLYGTAPATWTVHLGGAGGTSPALALLNTEGSYRQYGVAIPAASVGALASKALYIRQTSAAACDLYIDAVQLEAGTTWTTYCDGDQPGCKWSGTRHGSTSYRWDSREGGVVRDLVSYYGMHIQSVRGYGGPTKESMLEPLAFVDGSVYQGTRASGRILQLTVDYEGTTLALALSKRKAFLLDCNRNKVWPQQPCLWRYTGAGKTVQVRAFVESGDEGAVMDSFHEVMPLNLMAVEDPYWEELREQAAWLAATATLAQKGAMKLSGISPESASTSEWDATTGPWSALGITALGGNHTIYAMARDGAGNLYVGGDFTDLNGIAEADYIAKRDVDGTWNALAGGAGGVVYTICPIVGSDYLLVGGDFPHTKDIDGNDVENTHHIAYWIGTSWHQLPIGPGFGGGVNDTVYSITPAGSIGGYYVTGLFAYAEDGHGVPVADTAGLARLNSNLDWAAVGGGVTPGTGILCSAVDAAGNLYIGGGFTDAGSVGAADYIAKYDGAAWSSIGVFDDVVRGMAFGPDGRLYAVGDFHTIDGVSIAHVAVYNGQSWSALGTGLDASGRSVIVMPSGTVCVAGDFTTAGGVTVDKLAFWNGTSWAASDVAMPAATTAHTLMTDGADLYIGIDKNTDASVAGTNDASVDADGWINCLGTAPCSPVIEVSSSTAGVIYAVRNYTTGQEILLALPVAANETITIDTRHGYEGIRSNYPWGVGRAITPALPSDLGTFQLLPGANKVTACGTTTGTMLFKMRWRIKHEGMEGGAT